MLQHMAKSYKQAKLSIPKPQVGGSNPSGCAR